MVAVLIIVTMVAFVTQVTYLLTPWSTVLLEKLTGSQLVRKFPTFYGTRRFITALTLARLLPGLPMLICLLWLLTIPLSLWLPKMQLLLWLPLLP